MKTKRWAFMSRFDIRDPDGGLYLRRWRIIQTPLFAIYLHKIMRPDWRPLLHDHPWSFIAIVLRGGYTEKRLDLHTRTTYRHRVKRLNVVRRDDAHYIESLGRNPTWTLCLVGARRRDWGYVIPPMQGSVEWGWMRWSDVA